MIAGTEEDRKSSDKKMVADDGLLRTLDCLRGRLLAERQASRVAKEDAELMGKKLIELENRLREETKLRNKAEKKLKFLMKKLESLKISPLLEESEQSSSSTSTSDPKDQETKSQITTPVTSQNLDHNVSETPSMQSLESPLSEENSSPKGAASSSSADYKSSPSCEDSKTENHSFSSLKDSRIEMEINARHESNNEDYVDNSLALVPVCWPVTKPSSELKIANKSVSEVLDALRHARERIQCSMERRHMIRVAPA